MRLIDADAVIPKGTKVTDNVIAVHDAITKAPTIDAVPVVRCKDCKYYTTEDFDGDILCGCTLYCAMLDITPDGFCSYGTRKDGGING